MRFVIVIVALGGVTLPSWATPFLGAEQCKSCHAQQYAQWLTTPHAKAHARLSREQQRDPRCTSCHSTSAQDGLVGVQCESCHGAGGNYWPEPVMRDPVLARAAGLKAGGEVQMCGQCHTVDSARVTPFNITEALKQVRHNGAPRE
jgi:hypothetical protein